MADAATPGLDHFWAVIPAGGAGTRLWPLSRSASPKFLLDLTGSGRTLLQQTVDRLEPVAAGPAGRRHGSRPRDAVAAQLPDLGSDAILAEPSPRDSMAAIGLAAAVVERRDPRRRDRLVRRRPRHRRPGVAFHDGRAQRRGGGGRRAGS